MKSTKMKNQLLFSLLISFCLINYSVAQKSEVDSSYNNPYYKNRMAVFKSIPDTKGAVVFLGNSITERGPWSEYFPSQYILNRGIGGDNTFGVLARLDKVIALAPKKIFIMIGINDVGRGTPLSTILDNYQKLVLRIRTESPKTKIYIQSVLPLNDSILTADYLKNKKGTVRELNIGLRELAGDLKVTYLDLHSDLFVDHNGDLKPELTPDGIHLFPKAYSIWAAYLKTHKHLR